ncbi:MAG: hypothetical protein QG646_2375 [Euryarchaeota archaeon]|nr:hypothetical protein [Euryarchaeota archaeon]
MIDIKQVTAATSNDKKAAIIIAAVKEAQTISTSQIDRKSLTKEQFSEKILPGISTDKDAPPWVHELLDYLWDLFF